MQRQVFRTSVDFGTVFKGATPDCYMSSKRSPVYGLPPD